MNILFLNWKDVENPEAGGAEIIAFEYARRLVKEGHRVTIFSRSFDNCEAEKVLDGVNLIRQGTRLSVYIKAFFYYKNLNKKPDLVIDMVNTLSWQTPLYVPREKRIAYVNQLAKEVLYYEFDSPLSQISYFLEPFQYFTYRNTKFMCYSKSTKKDLVDIGINGKNISTFSLGIDHKRYFKGGNKSRTPLFVFVARLVKMKRADLCIEAMRKIVKKHPEAQLMIVGRGPEEDKLQAEVKRRKLEKNIKFVLKDGFYIDQNPKDLKVKLMREAWALLLPSVKEGWGMVVTEAAACGTPSIVTRVTGLKDSVLENETGLVITSDPKVEDLANAMEKIISDPKSREELSENSVKWAKKFNWDKSYKEFKKIILGGQDKK